VIRISAYPCGSKLGFAYGHGSSSEAKGFAQPHFLYCQNYDLHIPPLHYRFETMNKNDNSNLTIKIKMRRALAMYTSHNFSNNIIHWLHITITKDTHLGFCFIKPSSLFLFLFFLVKMLRAL
jgi:hypothetical protein